MTKFTLFAGILCLCFTACSPPVLEHSAVQGYWQDENDPKALIKIGAKEMSFVYDNQLIETLAYTFSADCQTACEKEGGKACLTTTRADETGCYLVLDIVEDKMGLVYTTGTGRALSLQKTAAFEIPPPPPPPPFYEGKTLCYKKTKKGAQTYNAYMELSIANGKVNGYWVQESYGGHHGVGDLVGRIKDGVITAEYSFSIEGDKQIEMTIFKINEKQLAEAEGERLDKGRKSVFRDPANVTYNRSYEAVDCGSISEQIGWAKGK